MDQKLKELRRVKPDWNSKKVNITENYNFFFKFDYFLIYFLLILEIAVVYKKLGHENIRTLCESTLLAVAGIEKRKYNFMKNEIFATGVFN